MSQLSSIFHLQSSALIWSFAQYCMQAALLTQGFPRRAGRIKPAGDRGYRSGALALDGAPLAEQRRQFTQRRQPAADQRWLTRERAVDYSEQIVKQNRG